MFTEKSGHKSIHTVWSQSCKANTKTNNYKDSQNGDYLNIIAVSGIFLSVF